MAGHAKALAEYKDHPEQPVGPNSFWVSRVHYYKDAVNNVPDAINSLIVAYLIGPIFDDDLIKGYYWLLRTRELEVSERAWDTIRKSLSFVPESERKKAKGWISSGHVPAM